MTKIAIMGGRIVDPKNEMDEASNLYIAEGKIVKAAADDASFHPDQVIDATNCIVSPGFVDLQANLLSGSPDVSEFLSHLEIANRAGITHLGSFAFNDKHCLSAVEISFLQDLSHQEGRTKAYFIGLLTDFLEGQRLNELASYIEAGCVGFSNGHRGIVNTLIKRRCYDYLSMLDSKLYLLLGDPYLNQYGCMHEGEVSTRLGLPGIPAVSEHMSLVNELLLTEETGVATHVCRVSSSKSVSLLEKINHGVITVSSDVAIHQLFLTDENVRLENGLYHVRPPFRTAKDLTKLREGVKEGAISAITSDFIKLPPRTKDVPFQESTPGIAAWPLLLPLVLRLIEEEDLWLPGVISCITSVPADILGIDAGHLSAGSAANVVVFNPSEDTLLSDQEITMFGSNNPFLGTPLKGRVKHTIVDGRVVYSS